MKKVARFSSPILLVLSLGLAACQQAPAEPTAAPKAAVAAPTNTPAPAPTNTSAPAPTNTTAPAPTNTTAPAPTNTVAAAPTNTVAPMAAPTNTAAPAKPAAAASGANPLRTVLEEWAKNNPEITQGSSIVGEGSPDGKFFGVELSPPNAAANDPSRITVGVHQSESPDAARAQLSKLGDAIKADGSTREEHNDILGNRPVIVGTKDTATTAEGTMLFLANDRVGIVQVVLTPDKKGAINQALGMTAASLLMQLDPAGAAEMVAPPKPAAKP